MPRAGSTLIEQILSSHSQVEGTSELPDIPVLSREPGPYPTGILDASAERRQLIGEEYLKRASVQRRTDRPFFVDKLPNNWLFVPFIQLVLPNAKIIDARRHPLGCCFSNYRQHFARGQDFTYDLTHVGLYYADYVRLMAHIDTVLPGRVHRVIYERVVDDTESEIRRLLGVVERHLDDVELIQRVRRVGGIGAVVTPGQLRGRPCGLLPRDVECAPTRVLHARRRHS